MAAQPNPKRGLLLSGALLFALILTRAIFVSARREPSYAGRSVTSWLGTYHLAATQPGPFGRGVANPSQEALHALGPEAVPYLISALRRSEYPFTLFYWKFWQRASPGYRRFLPNPPLFAFQWRHNAILALGTMGPAAEPAIPALVRLLRNSDWSSQALILRTLNDLHARSSDLTAALRELASTSARRPQIIQALQPRKYEPQIALPLLIPALRDERLEIRAEALRLLEELGPGALEAVPVLVECIQDKDREIRYLSVRALREIGPAAASAIPALTKALADENSLVRSAATNTLRRLGWFPE